MHSSTLTHTESQSFGLAIMAEGPESEPQLEAISKLLEQVLSSDASTIADTVSPCRARRRHRRP